MARQGSRGGAESKKMVTAIEEGSSINNKYYLGLQQGLEWEGAQQVGGPNTGGGHPWSSSSGRHLWETYYYIIDVNIVNNINNSHNGNADNTKVAGS